MSEIRELRREIAALRERISALCAAGLRIGEEANLVIEGVVIHSIRSHRHVRPG